MELHVLALHNLELLAEDLLYARKAGCDVGIVLNIVRREHLVEQRDIFGVQCEHEGMNELRRGFCAVGLIGPSVTGGGQGGQGNCRAGGADLRLRYFHSTSIASPSAPNICPTSYDVRQQERRRRGIDSRVWDALIRFGRWCG